MLELFSDIFAYRENFGTRIDARAKLVLTMVLLLCVVFSSRMILPLMVFALALGGTLALRLPARLVLARLIGPMAMAAVLVLLQSLLAGRRPAVSFSLLGIHLTVFQEGLQRGLLLAAKVLGAVTLVQLLSLVTPAHRIFYALLWLRVPRGWTEMAMLIYRYTFSLLDDIADVAAAQRVRLGYHGLRRSLSSAGTLAGAVIVRSIDQAARTHEAMKMRGYNGIMPFSPLPAVRGKDLWLMAAGSALAVAACLLLEGVV